MVGVCAQLPGRTRERVGDPRAEVALEIPKGAPGSNAGMGRVIVHRITPGAEAPRGAGRLGRRAIDAEKGAKVPASLGGHPREGARSAAAGEAEEDLFGLVIAGMTEEDKHASAGVALRPGIRGEPGSGALDLRSNPVGGCVEGRVPGPTGVGFESIRGAPDLHEYDLDRR